MKALVFRIRALAPLLITRLGAGEENSSTAFDFIPGSVLRGLAVNLYLGKKSVGDAVADPACRRLFFDGTVRYLNAYPLNPLGERTLPRPLSWRVNKAERENQRATIYDFAVAPEELDAPVPPPGAFCWRDEDDVWLCDPDRHVCVHNASEDRNVKGKGKSVVYRYEAIAEGAAFGGVILAEDAGDLEVLRQLLDQVEVSVGGSRSAGYGRVRIGDLKIVEDWREYDPDEDLEDEIVIVTLLSDAILRDKNGQPTTDLHGVLPWRHLRAYREVRVVGGFNRKWGLPLVQMPALEAGSVYVYRASEVDPAYLKRLELEGIGERRTEGFGRIAVNWHTRAQLTRRPIVDRWSTLAAASELSQESRQLALRMAERRFRMALDRNLVGALTRLKIEHPPSKAQLSRLRLVLRRAWYRKDGRLVIGHLEGLKGARAQFERARVGGRRFLAWLKDGIEREELWQDYLRPEELPSLAGVVPEPTSELKAEYTLRLLDALVQRTLKEQR